MLRPTRVGMLAVALAGAGCASAQSPAASPSGSAGALSKIRAGWVGVEDPHNAGVRDGAFSKSTGVPVQWTQFQGAPTIDSALVSNSIDITMLGSPAVAIAIAHKIPLKVIWVAEGVGSNEGLVAKKGISSVADLKGKTVATVFGSTSQFTLVAALNQAGLDAHSVNMVNLDPPQMLSAWQRNSVDAAYIWNPVLHQLTSNGGHMLVDTAQLAQSGNGTYDLIVARSDFLKAHPDTVAKWVGTEATLNQRYAADPAGVSKEVAGLLSEKPSLVQSLMSNYQYFTATEESSAAVLGTPGHPGSLAQVLEKEAQAAVRLGLLSSAPPLSVYQAALAGNFAQQAVSASG